MSSRIELNHKIHVLTKKEELDSVRIQGKVVVVLDVLFATTTMVTALAHGAREVVPVLDEAAARAQAKSFDAGEFVLAGELNANTLPGFAHPAPLTLLEHGVKGKTLVYSTTNGTVALSQTDGASQIYCGALLNARAVCEHIVARHPRDTVLIVCAGSANNFNLEDFYGAGVFVERLAALLGASADLSDAAKAALGFSRQARLPESLFECRVGRMMLERGLRHEVEYACQVDRLPVVPVLQAGRLRLLSPAPGPR
jgi:2-phosphosulfolactate phosphatase